MRERSPREGNTDTETERPAEEPWRSSQGVEENLMRMGSVGVTGARGQEREGRRANIMECGGPWSNGWVLGLLAACGASLQARCSGEKRKTEQCEQGQRPFPFLTQKAGHCSQGPDLPFFYLNTHLGNCSIYICI